MSAKLRKKSIQAINEQGLLLVYPIHNRKEPNSLWRELYPRSQMRWEWDDEGDSRVADLWRLREELSRSREVIYGKWYQGRATFFSRPVFASLYRLSREFKPAKWTRESTEILEVLEMDSPLSTKQIKEAVNLQGKLLESTYERAMKALWQHFDIVGFGEVEDSSFPSLAVGASSILFEDLIAKAQSMPLSQALKTLNQALPEPSHWRQFWNRIAKTSSTSLMA